MGPQNYIIGHITVVEEVARHEVHEANIKMLLQLLHAHHPRTEAILLPELRAVAASLAGPWTICCLLRKVASLSNK